ncbi:MAG: hypothetical protein HY978_03210 [Candidatus Liptonbacteria bacterium]|nr:hypothetical protein [Candidatus Liptonbacteria bacterium]
MTIIRSLALALFVSLTLPNLVLAAARPLSVSAWVPYWKKTAGVAETTAHLNQIQTISPFSFEVGPDDQLIDKLKLGEEPWLTLLTSARKKKAEIIPTIHWADGDAISLTLASSTLRKAQIAAIVSLLKDNKFNGIDIDYENKPAESQANFSRFLRELAAALKKDQKILTCSIEPRTPWADRTTTAQGSEPRTRPAERDGAGRMYANDYKAIGQYCDRVRIMAYDQGRIDVKLDC